MAKVNIPSDHGAPEQPWDHEAQADRYAGGDSRSGSFGSAVNSYASKTPTLGAGGPHNRAARGHESET